MGLILMDVAQLNTHLCFLLKAYPLAIVSVAMQFLQVQGDFSLLPFPSYIFISLGHISCMSVSFQILLESI